MADHDKQPKTNSNLDSTGLSYNSIDKSIIEDLLKCDLCNIIFDLNKHSPLVVKCGHTFCKRCISLKSNNIDKNTNKPCPLDKMKNAMNIDSAIPNLKLEHIIKKLTTLNKKQKVINKPLKKGISPIKPHYSNNTINAFNNINSVVNNNNNNNCINVALSSNLKNNNDNNNTNINVNVNNINNINNKKKDNSNSNKNKNNINQKKKNNKANNINFVNTMKSKINSISVNNINNVNNNKDLNKINNISKKENPPNGIGKTMSSEMNINLNSSRIDEEINSRNDRYIFEDDNRGINNVTIDTIPINEERSLGDTSFRGDINELLLKSTMTKKKSITEEETITEEFNSSSSKNLKKLNLLGNQDSLNNINFNIGNNINDLTLQSQQLSQPFLKPPYNFSLTPNKNKFNLQNYNQQMELNSKYNNDSSMTNQEDINSLNIYNINNENNNNVDKRPNDNKLYQIRTVYDKIQLKLKNSSNDKDNKEKNNNIINNISNNIIIINDDI